MAGLWISSGVIVWTLHFTVLYGFTALACARGLPAAVPWVAGIATLGALASLGAIAWAQRRRAGEFNAWLTIAVAALALVAVVYETIPLFIVPICA